MVLAPLVRALADLVVRRDASRLFGVGKQMKVVHVSSPGPFCRLVFAARTFEGSKTTSLRNAGR
eukprot:3179204-Pleurochrysis_carterae.AAC.1